MLIYVPTDKAKPVARRGRKATGLQHGFETAGLPGKVTRLFIPRLGLPGDPPPDFLRKRGQNRN